MNITFPPVTIPPGSESDALKLLKSITQFFQFSADPAVTVSTGKRAVAASLEHSLSQGVKDLESEMQAASD